MSVATSAAASLGPCCLWVFYPSAPFTCLCLPTFCWKSWDRHSLPRMCEDSETRSNVSCRPQTPGDPAVMSVKIVLWSPYHTVSRKVGQYFCMQGKVIHRWKKVSNCAENRKRIKDQKLPKLNDKAFEALSFKRCRNRLCLWRGRDTSSSCNRASLWCSVTAGGQFTISPHNWPPYLYPIVSKCLQFPTLLNVHLHTIDFTTFLVDSISN